MMATPPVRFTLAMRVVTPRRSEHSTTEGTVIKHLLKFGLAIAACSLLLSPRQASANESGFKNWKACDEYMFQAHEECMKITHDTRSGVTAAMCEASWEWTSEYCDDHYDPYR